MHIQAIDPVIWADTALGYPRHDAVHAQQMVPGYQLGLEANDQASVYHTDADNTVILCQAEALPSFPLRLVRSTMESPGCR